AFGKVALIAPALPFEKLERVPELCRHILLKFLVRLVETRSGEQVKYPEFRSGGRGWRRASVQGIQVLNQRFLDENVRARLAKAIEPAAIVGPSRRTREPHHSSRHEQAAPAV